MRRAVYGAYERQWHDGNNAGRGFATDEAYFDGWPQLYTAQNDTEISIYEQNGVVVGVGNAEGPWGVELTK